MNIVRFIGIIITLPIFILGAIINFIPYTLLKKRDPKIQHHQFVGSMRLTFGVIYFLPVYIFISIIVSLFWSITGAFWIALFACPFLLVFTYYYARKSRMFWKMLTNKTLFTQIRNQRKQVIELLNQNIFNQLSNFDYDLKKVVGY
jgi:ABC-type multidrug transport system fused ATPase/permease subunit